MNFLWVAWLVYLNKAILKFDLILIKKNIKFEFESFNSFKTCYIVSKFYEYTWVSTNLIRSKQLRNHNQQSIKGIRNF